MARVAPTELDLLAFFAKPGAYLALERTGDDSSATLALRTVGDILQKISTQPTLSATQNRLAIATTQDKRREEFAKLNEQLKEELLLIRFKSGDDFLRTDLGFFVTGMWQVLGEYEKKRAEVSREVSEVLETAGRLYNDFNKLATTVNDTERMQLLDKVQNTFQRGITDRLTVVADNVNKNKTEALEIGARVYRLPKQ